MNIPDLINGAFEGLSGFLMFNNVRALVRDKQVRGMSLISAGFFTSWSAWNLFFYPHIQQWVSLLGSIPMALSNIAWISLAVYYTYFHQPKTTAQAMVWFAKNRK